MVTIDSVTAPDGHLYVSTRTAAKILGLETTESPRRLVADRPGLAAIEAANVPGGGTIRVWTARAGAKRRIRLHLNDLYAYLARGPEAPPALTPAEAAGLLRFERSPGGRKR